MKKANSISVIILLAVIIGCGENRQSTDDFITIDVSKSYPKKELILQDFLDVEYIPLETTDDFLSTGYIQAIGKEIIVDRTYIPPNPATEILLFSRAGKSLKKIDRRGQGPEEYISIVSEVVLDEESNEIYVNSLTAAEGKIYVYDLFGNFKRILTAKEGHRYTVIKNFDHDHFICYYGVHYYALRSPDADIEYEKNIFWIISKQDGSVTKEIEIPYQERKPIVQFNIPVNGRMVAVSVNNVNLTPYLDSWILVETSSDTIYRYLPDYRMTPFMVRTPSIQSMDPEIFLVPCVLTDSYWFMQFIKKDGANGEFPRTDLVYDIKERTLFETVVYNDDFTSKRPVRMWYENRVTTLINSEDIVFAEKLDAFELVEAYKEGKLKGKLKEIAAGLDEEDNPVIMIAKNKR